VSRWSISHWSVVIGASGSRASSAPAASGSSTIEGSRPIVRAIQRTISPMLITSGPPSSNVWPAKRGSVAAAIASPTSAANTGWNFTGARSTGTTGSRATMPAKRLMNWSSRPNTIDGRMIAAPGNAARTAASPRPLLLP